VFRFTLLDLKAFPTMGCKWLCEWLYNSNIASSGRNCICTTPQQSLVTTNKLQASGIIAVGSAIWCSIWAFKEVLTYPVHNI
jgi:hypothetical protein